MKNGFSLLSLVMASAVAGTLGMGPAFADTSTTTTKAAAPTLLDKLAMTYVGVIDGPNGQGASRLPNEDGSLGDTTAMLDSYLFMGYRVSKQIQVGVAPEWETHFLGGNTPLKLDDPMIKVNGLNLFKRGNLTLGFADLRIYLPVTDASRAKDLTTAVRSTQSLSYEIPKSRFTLGTYSYVKVWAYGSNAPVATPLTTAYAYLGPHVDYQMSKTVTATVLFEMYAHHQMGDSLKSWSAADPIDLEPGISWDVTSKINVTPYLNIYPYNPTLSSTTINMLVIGSIL